MTNVVLTASIRIEVLWQADGRDEVDGRLYYIDQSEPHDRNPFEDSNSQAERFVLPLLLDIDKAEAAIVAYPLFVDANGA